MASPNKRRSFTALLEPDGSRLRWTIARLPFAIDKAWPERNGRRVHGEIEGFAFRTTLFPDPGGQGHILLVNKKMQAASGAKAGARVRIWLEPDLEERAIEMPSELARALNANRELRRWFGQLSDSMRREIGKWAAEPKSAEARQRRAEKIAERLMLTMEGEVEPPPVLRVAFERKPLARQGWQMLTLTQRRNHLLGIFYYEGVEARQRRAAQAIADALRAAKREKAKR
jgi:hypothetical protein